MEQAVNLPQHTRDYIDELHAEVAQLKTDNDILTEDNDYLATQLYEAETEVARLQADIDNIYGPAHSLALTVADAGWFKAEVSSVVQVSPLEQIVTLSVDMTPGQALYVRRGSRLTLSHAESADFAAVKAEY